MRTFNKKMQKMPYIVLRGVMLQSMLLLLMVITQTHAAVVESLYEVEVPVVDQDAGTQRAAFNQGLKEVLIRVTGDRNIFSLIKLPRSASYVKQFQYREFENKDIRAENQSNDIVLSGKNQLPTQLLWVQFNETKVNEFVQKNALPLWGKRRNETIIWLAVNDGVNRYILKDPDESLLKSITDATATRRAVPIIWPQVKREERAIRFADVWAGFQRPIIKLSSVYTDGPIIIGRLQWNNGQWNSEWSLILDDNKTDWVIEHSEYEHLLAEAIDTAADAMGQQFALFDTGDIKSFHSLGIQINNINSIVALNDLKQYLSTVPMVQQFKLEHIENDQVVFDMSLRTNTEDFLKTVQQDSKLILMSEESIKKSESNPVIPSDAAKNVSAEGYSVQDDLVKTISKAAAYQFQFQP